MTTPANTILQRIRVAALVLICLPASARATELPPAFTKPAAITVAELSGTKSDGVSVVEVSDYAFGGYAGDFTSPPHGDVNARRAFVIRWKDHAQRFVFWHDASYCPFFELPSGAGASFQWWEGNEGWAEPLCDFGRMERNSFVDVVEPGPDRVWVRWSYVGPNPQTGEAAYRATEDFWAYPNGLILRRQTYESLRPKDHHGYTREPMELIGLAPVGKLWSDVLRTVPRAEGGGAERHALAALDAFSARRHDVYWKPKEGEALGESTRRRDGCGWKEIDDARGVVLAVPLKDGAPFCAFGDASGFRRDYTRVKEHSFPDTGGSNWGSASWDHWPVGWINSRGHDVNAETLKKCPNHFSPAGMDFFALPNEVSARLVCWSLLGVGNNDNLEPVRAVARRWLEKGDEAVARPDSGADLPALR